MISKNPPYREKRQYYAVLNDHTSNCELAVAQAIAIAKEFDEKITLLISKLNYEIIKTQTSTISKLLCFASKKERYNGCCFNVFHTIELNDISDVVLVYDTPCGEIMRMVYNTSVKNIILIPANSLDWEVFCQTMNPILINTRKEVLSQKN